MLPAMRMWEREATGASVRVRSADNSDRLGGHFLQCMGTKEEAACGLESVTSCTGNGQGSRQERRVWRR